MREVALARPIDQHDAVRLPQFRRILWLIIFGAMLPLAGCAGNSAPPVAPLAGGKPATKSGSKPSLAGSGLIRVSTDSSGRVVSAVMIKPIHPTLDEPAVAWALAHWRGPPNQTKDIPITFVLDETKRQTATSSPATSSH
jgi:hypothetical protein